MYVFALVWLAGISLASPETIAPGATVTREVHLNAGQFTCFLIGESNTDLRIEISAEGAALHHQINTLHFSHANLRFCHLARDGAILSAKVTSSGATPANVQFSFEPAREPTAADLAEWGAQQALANARSLANAPSRDKAAVRAAFESAIAQWRATGNTYQVATAQRGLGDFLAGQADAQAALVELKSAAALFQSGGWKFEAAVALQNLGAAQTQLGEYRASLDSRGQAQDLYRALGDRTGEGYAVHGRAEIWWRMGQLQNAQAEYGRALTAWRVQGNRRMEVQALNALGLVNTELGRYPTASQDYLDAGRISRAGGDQSGLLMTINNQGLLSQEYGRYPAARANFTRALALAVQAKDERSRAYILQNMGDTWAAEGQPEKAAGFYRESIALKATLHDVQAEAESHRKLGLALLALHRPKEAEAEVDAALSMHHSISDRSGEAQSLAALAALHSAAGQIAGAASDMARAIALVETTRLELRGRDLRTSFFARERDYYDEAIDLALKPGGGGVREAFEWSEKSRARAMLDAASQPGGRPFQFFTAADIQAKLLGPDDVLVEYSINRRRALAFVVTPSTLRLVRLASPDLIAGARTGKSRARLASLVWWPLQVPSQARRVVIAAESEMERVPFAALPEHDGPLLIDRCEIALIPSASFILARRQEGGASGGAAGIAVFADPVFSAADSRLGSAASTAVRPDDLARLRFTLEEAHALEDLVPVRTHLFTGSAASVVNFRKAAAEPGAALHIATHTAGAASDSRIVFSQFAENGSPMEGDVGLDEVFRLAVRRDLVVLAGCRTAEGQTVRGEGLASLTRAFLYSGARGVVGTLWDVNDRLTSDLTKDFYAGMFRNGMSPAAALRAAQLKVRAAQSKLNRGDADWAAFTFNGDWRIFPGTGVK